MESDTLASAGDLSEEIRERLSLVADTPSVIRDELVSADSHNPAQAFAVRKSLEAIADGSNIDMVIDNSSTSSSPVYGTNVPDPFDCSWCDSAVTAGRDVNLSVDYGDTATLKSNSSTTCLPAVTPNDISDCSPVSVSGTSAPGDMASVAYMKLRDSAASSVCSASPFESPTHNSANGRRIDLPFDDAMSNRPDSLCLQRSVLQQRERQWLKAKKGSYSSLSECDSSHSGSMEALIEAATSTPLHSQGTVSMEGDMMTFVADGINELIKRSRGDSLSGSNIASRTPRSCSSGSVCSSASGWSASGLSASGHTHIARSPSVHTPDDIPPIDLKAVDELEQHARKVADSLDSMMETLTNKLFKISSLTCTCLDVYKDAVDNTCEVVDNSIKSMYALMAKCEELSRTVTPVYEIKEQIREIKRLLDLFEAQAASFE